MIAAGIVLLAFGFFGFRCRSRHHQALTYLNSDFADGWDAAFGLSALVGVVLTVAGLAVFAWRLLP